MPQSGAQDQVMEKSLQSAPWQQQAQQGAFPPPVAMQPNIPPPQVYKLSTFICVCSYSWSYRRLGQAVIKVFLMTPHAFTFLPAQTDCCPFLS